MSQTRQPAFVTSRSIRVTSRFVSCNTDLKLRCISNFGRRWMLVVCHLRFVSSCLIVLNCWIMSRTNTPNIDYFKKNNWLECICYYDRLRNLLFKDKKHERCMWIQCNTQIKRMGSSNLKLHEQKICAFYGITQHKHVSEKSQNCITEKSTQTSFLWKPSIEFDRNQVWGIVSWDKYWYRSELPCYSQRHSIEFLSKCGLQIA